MKVLIIKIGAIGDVIMALPVVNEIKTENPNTKITWVCGAIVAPILELIPTIDNVIIVDEKTIFSKNIFSILKSFVKLYGRIGFRAYSIILNYHVDWRYKLIDMFSFSKTKLSFLRSGNRPIPLPGRSRVYEHIRLYKQLDETNSSILSFPEFCFDRIVVDRSIVDVIDSSTIILSPGGAKNTLYEQSLRRWPVDNYKALAERLLLKGYKVAIVGAKTDEWVIPYFKDVAVLNLIGKFSLIQLIKLFNNCKMVITHDSGPFHLAAFAVQTFVIGLFGPTNEREFTYINLSQNNPQRIFTIWGGKHLNCRPCYYGKYFSQQCTNNLCMQDISVEMVIGKIEMILNP